MNPLPDDITYAEHAWDLAVFETAKPPRAIRDAAIMTERDTLLVVVGGQRSPIIGFITTCHRDEPTRGAFEIEGLPKDDRGGPGHAEQVVHLYAAGRTVCPICRGGAWFDPTRAGESGIEAGAEAALDLLRDPSDCPAASSHHE